MTELAKALISTSAFASPKNILQAIPEAAAHERPSTSSGIAAHPIYAEVWHMAYWQQVSLDWIEGKPVPVPLHASEGFPSNVDEPWDLVCDRFLTGTEKAAAIANDVGRLEVVVACPNVDEPDRTMTVHDQLVSLAAHNAYHLGRVVLLRQLLGIWPPPAGGYTW